MNGTLDGRLDELSDPAKEKSSPELVLELRISALKKRTRKIKSRYG